MRKQSLYALTFTLAALFLLLVSAPAAQAASKLNVEIGRAHV